MAFKPITLPVLLPIRIQLADDNDIPYGDTLPEATQKTSGHRASMTGSVSNSNDGRLVEDVSTGVTTRPRVFTLKPPGFKFVDTSPSLRTGSSSEDVSHVFTPRRKVEEEDVLVISPRTRTSPACQCTERSSSEVEEHDSEEEETVYLSRGRNSKVRWSDQYDSELE
jgi:hypothetical protein